MQLTNLGDISNMSTLIVGAINFCLLSLSEYPYICSLNNLKCFIHEKTKSFRCKAPTNNEMYEKYTAHNLR